MRKLLPIVGLFGGLLAGLAVADFSFKDSSGTPQNASAVTDGANATVGAKADAAWSGTGSGSVVAILKALYAAVLGPLSPAPAGSAATFAGNTCGSAADNCVLKASAGNLYGVYAECTSACWLMLFNATAKPANGATTAGVASGNLVECIDIAANSSKSLTYPVFPRAFSVGVTAVISSTACATLTASTVGFISGTAN